MKIQIDSLSSVDPLRVPLPHGTEVTTRVDRQVGQRLVRQGAMGRVVSIESSGVCVRIVGVGQVRYAREELTPRNSGQLKYALRREAAWQALSPHVVLETVVGSRAWGLADEESDTDMRGVFVLPFSWTTGLVDAPTDLVSVGGSENYWEVGKAFRQAIRADPNTLETLLLPAAASCDPLGQWILESREAFVSSEIYGTFGRYALSQLKRLKQGLRLAEHRAVLLGWLAGDPAMTLDQAAAKLSASAKLESTSEADRVLRSKQYVKQLYSSMFDQGLLASRDFASLVCFAQTQEHGFDLPRELRPKNAYNLLRLLALATTWLKTGTPEFEAKGELRAELLAVKRQQVEISRIIERAEELAAELDEARESTPLPAHPDVGRIDALLRKIRQEAARRWHEQEPGAFARDAPTLALATWND